MKKGHFFSLALLAVCVGASAQDPIHGVDGYYNWTAAQLKASDALGVGNNGKKVKGWYPEVGYTDDMEYVRFTMGINNNVNETEWGGFQHRSELVLKENTPGEGVMTITRAYPVVAFKFSIPENNEGTGVLSGYFEPQFNAYDADGNGGRLWLNGLDGNSRARLVHYSGTGVLTDALGRDSVKLNNGNNGYSSYRTANTVHKEYKDTIWHVLRLDPKVGEKKTDILFAMDLSTICDEAKNGDEAIRSLDTTNIKLSGFSLGFLGVHADTLAYEIVDGDTVGSHVKTIEERPTVYLKWIKTFASMKDFEASLSDENNWGDGPAVDPNKPVLNSALYEMQQFMYNYKFSDRLGVLNEAYEKALAVYNDAGSKPEDYKAQIEALSVAKSAFLGEIAYAGESPMNTIFNLQGLALGLETTNKTIGDYTGKLLVPVSPENAASFLFVENGEINGQKVYNLKTASGTIVQANDGSLMLVDPNQLTGSNAASVIFTNRGTTDDPGYDMKVGRYYYYYDEMEGRLLVTEEVPTTDTKDEIASYLFFPQAAVYDPSDHDAENYPMSSGEGSAWEFNGDVEMKVEPAYAASFEMYDWDASQKELATKRATLPYVEGWSVNGYRMSTLLEVDKTLEDGSGSPMSCLKLSVMDKYDNIHADSVNVAENQTDWTAAQQISIMREHGKYNSALNRVPQPNQQCDSLYAINMNSGINRYFAMKWKSNNPEITFNGLTFFVRKNIEEPGVGMEGLLEKRGDVYIWDLVECGIPFGDRKACAQYMSWNGVTSPDDAVYVDWMRFYDSLDAIPSETIPTAISDVTAGTSVLMTVSGNQVKVYCEGEVAVYSVDGKLISSVLSDGVASFVLPEGLYLVKTVNGNQSVVKKVLVK